MGSAVQGSAKPSAIPGSMEEEGGFGVYGEKTRYATLQQKQKIENLPNNRGYETLRHFRNNIPSLVSMRL